MISMFSTGMPVMRRYTYKKYAKSFRVSCESPDLRFHVRFPVLHFLSMNVLHRTHHHSFVTRTAYTRIDYS